MCRTCPNCIIVFQILVQYDVFIYLFVQNTSEGIKDVNNIGEIEQEPEPEKSKTWSQVASAGRRTQSSNNEKRKIVKIKLEFESETTTSFSYDTFQQQALQRFYNLTFNVLDFLLNHCIYFECGFLLFMFCF